MKITIAKKKLDHWAILPTIIFSKKVKLIGFVWLRWSIYFYRRLPDGERHFEWDGKS